jgi:hypothetical protein
MLNKEQITADLVTWLKEFVEKPNSALGNWPPCPYARQARLNNKVEIVFTQARDLLFDVVNDIPMLEHKDVIVYCFDHTEISADALAVIVAGMNQAIMKRNVVALEDHPDAVELINGVQMNFGQCGLLLVSNLDKLNGASDQLRSKGYYHAWSQENIDDVVTWRYE